MMKKPMAAFQNPITDQGMVSPKNTSKQRVGDAEAAGRERSRRSTSRTAMVAMTSVANSTRRPAILLSEPQLKDKSSAARSSTM